MLVNLNVTKLEMYTTCKIYDAKNLEIPIYVHPETSFVCSCELYNASSKCRSAKFTLIH